MVTYSKGARSAEVIEPPVIAAPKKRTRITAEQWTSQVGSRQSMRVKYPTIPKGDTTGSIFAVGADPDHPTDQQARSSPQAHEWAKARAKERAQLEKYQVFTKVNKSDIPEGTRIVDTKWVYLVKRKADGSIEKYKARKVGRGFTQEAGVNYLRPDDAS